MGGSGDEIEGFELMNMLSNYGVLHQLMFSTVMLHWSMYAPLPSSQRLTCERWQALNHDVGEDDEQMQNALRMIYNCIGRSFIPRMQIWPARSDGNTQNETIAAVRPDPSVEGWARLVGGGFPAPAGTGGTITYRSIRN